MSFTCTVHRKNHLDKNLNLTDIKAMIKFIEEKPTKEFPVFEDVEENQFFVYNDGCLCQKTSYDTFVTITDTTGQPYSDVEEGVSKQMRISRILPKIVKIEY